MVENELVAHIKQMESMLFGIHYSSTVQPTEYRSITKSCIPVKYAKANNIPHPFSHEEKASFGPKVWAQLCYDWRLKHDFSLKIACGLYSAMAYYIDQEKYGISYCDYKN